MVGIGDIQWVQKNGYLTTDINALSMLISGTATPVSAGEMPAKADSMSPPSEREAHVHRRAEPRQSRKMVRCVGL